MNRAEFAEYFFLHIRRKFKRQKIAAEFYGVSDSMISAVASGRKPPTKQMLEDMGMTREVIKTEIYCSKIDPGMVNKGSTGNIATGSYEIR